MICKTCGEDLTGKGLIVWIEHPCNAQTFEYKVPTDIEMRTALIEHGFPDMVFDFFKYCRPTEMERVIFENEKPEPQDPIFFVGPNSPFL